MTAPLATPASAAAPSLVIRPAGAAELGFVIATWQTEHGKSRDGYMSRENYKRLHKPAILDLLNREDTWLLGAFRGARMVGWIAWTPGRLPAVHFAYVHHTERRKGVFTALLRDAMVGNRFVYTFRGARLKHRAGRIAKLRNKQSNSGPSYDERMVEALARRGVFAAFVPVSTWGETR